MPTTLVGHDTTAAEVIAGEAVAKKINGCTGRDDVRVGYLDPAGAARLWDTSLDLLVQVIPTA